MFEEYLHLKVEALVAGANTYDAFELMVYVTLKMSFLHFINHCYFMFVDCIQGGGVW